MVKAEGKEKRGIFWGVEEGIVEDLASDGGGGGGASRLGLLLRKAKEEERE